MTRSARLTLCLLAAAILAAAQTNPRTGFYQWAATLRGQPPADLLAPARERIAAQGAGLMRIYLGPRFDYFHRVLDPSRFADLGERTPARILASPRYRALLDDPALPTLVLTVYPGLDYGAGLDDISLLRPWSPREQEAEHRQIAELVEWLYREYGASSKTVILANAEADDKLLDIMNYTGSPELAIANLIAWQNTRFDAVRTTRSRFPSARLRVLNAFEISLVNLKIGERRGRWVRRPDGKWNVLTDVVPKVGFDLISYSAYESTNSPWETQHIDTPAAGTGPRLLRDLQKLARAVNKPVMVGELGFAYDRFDRLATGGVEARLASALEALARARPAYVVFWQVFDAPWEGRDPVEWGWLDPRRQTPVILTDFLRNFGSNVPQPLHMGKMP
jgi:hypothetical protein